MSRKIEIENRIHNLKSQVIDLKYRATGRTTRLVDEYIQKIYENKGEWVKIADHYYSAQANKMVADKVAEWLKAEHSSDKFKYRRAYGFEIMLVSCARDSVLDEVKRINQEIVELEKQLKEMEGWRMATLSNMAFDYSLKRGTGKKAQENFFAGAKAVIREIQEAHEIGGIDAVVQRINSFIEEIKR